MIKVLDTNCYTTVEITEKIRGDYNLKRIEYLRNLGLLPRPIKVGTGSGTIGCYPPAALNLLRKVEKEREKGKTYREILLEQQDIILSVHADADNLRQLRLQKQVVGNLTTGKLTEVSFKLTGEVKKPIDPNGVKKELDKTVKELKRLFRQKNNLSPKVLDDIKFKIKKIQELRTTKGFVAKASALLTACQKEGADKVVRAHIGN